MEMPMYLSVYNKYEIFRDEADLSVSVVSFISGSM
jgi:hypothetical protein